MTDTEWRALRVELVARRKALSECDDPALRDYATTLLGRFFNEHGDALLAHIDALTAERDRLRSHLAGQCVTGSDLAVPLTAKEAELTLVMNAAEAERDSLRERLGSFLTCDSCGYTYDRANGAPCWCAVRRVEAERDGLAAMNKAANEQLESVRAAWKHTDIEQRRLGAALTQTERERAEKAEAERDALAARVRELECDNEKT